MIMKKIGILFFIIYISSFSSIFRTAIYPVRLFVSEKGGVSVFTVVNNSMSKIKVAIDSEDKENVLFYPKKLILNKGESKKVRVKISNNFFKNNNDIIYITEEDPLIIIDGKKIMPRHGITVKKMP